MIASFLKSLPIERRLLAIVGSILVVFLSVSAAFQLYDHIQDTESNFRETHVRITESLARPLSTVLPLNDTTVLFGYMDLFDNDGRAAGVAVVKGLEIIKTQQSLDYLDMPSEILNAVAVKAAAQGKHVLQDFGTFQIVGLPIKDSADRAIGSLAIAWSTANILDESWYEFKWIAALNALFCMALLFVLTVVIRKRVTRPLGTIVAAIDEGVTNGGMERTPRWIGPGTRDRKRRNRLIGARTEPLQGLRAAL